MYLFLLAGFLGFYTLFLRVNVFVKIIAIGGFLNCFFSAAPFLSFSSYLILIASCYFYILLTKIKNWTFVFNILFTLLLLNCFLMLMQSINRDSLLNFGLDKGVICWGIIANRMQFQSFLIILFALLIQKFRKKTLAPITLSGVLYTVLYGGIKLHIYGSFLVRLTCWKATITLAMRHPITGWGIGSYRYVFPALSKSIVRGQVFASAHNDWLQVLFETGFPGLIVMISIFGILFYKAIQTRKWLLVTGLLMVCYDLSVHFPMREVQCIPILIVFLAYAGGEVCRGTWRNAGENAPTK